MDKRVIDIPFLFRWMLVNLIIAPFRAPKSAKEYRKLWVERGSPLKFYGEDVRDLLQGELDDDYVVALGMRYQSPSIKSALEDLRDQKVAKIIVVPLFPQYASATSGSVHDKVMEIVQQWQIIPQINFISTFVEEPGFYKTFASLGKNIWTNMNTIMLFLVFMVCLSVKSEKVRSIIIVNWGIAVMLIKIKTDFVIEHNVFKLLD